MTVCQHVSRQVLHSRHVHFCVCIDNNSFTKLSLMKCNSFG